MSQSKLRKAMKNADLGVYEEADEEYHEMSSWEVRARAQAAPKAAPKKECDCPCYCAPEWDGEIPWGMVR